MKQQIRTTDAPQPSGAYSQGIRAGDLVFVAGQGALDPATGDVVGETIEEQTELTMKNIEAILRAAGGSLDDVVKLTAHLSSMELFDRFDAAYGGVMPQVKPVRTTVESGIGELLVEIDVVAYIPVDR
jgi:2-iminobutanoate/2-iminopropanoate deaminase